MDMRIPDPIQIEGGKMLGAIATLFIGGTLARILVSDEPFDTRRFVGELILAVIGAVALWAFGVLKGMSFWELLLFGSLASLGGVRILEWMIKLVKTFRAGP